MPTLTVYIADSGTMCSNGRPSGAGHMWYSLNDGTGEKHYGFAQTKEFEGKPFAPGEVKKHDNETYTGEVYSKQIEITQEQFDAMTAFGNNPTAGGFNMYYDFLINSCIDFVWKALEKGGLNPSGFEGMVYPIFNRSLIEGMVFKEFIPDMMAPWTDLFDAGASIPPPRIDPLIVDLDGDGVETMGVNNGAYFDHDGNGFAERTGWADSDDGLLVMDRNNDGIINNGGELFGDQTLLQNGTKATDGFQALAELDTNADGKIDTNDTVFAQLKIWQDLDGDGRMEIPCNVGGATNAERRTSI